MTIIFSPSAQGLFHTRAEISSHPHSLIPIPSLGGTFSPCSPGMKVHPLPPHPPPAPPVPSPVVCLVMNFVFLSDIPFCTFSCRGNVVRLRPLTESWNYPGWNVAVGVKWIPGGIPKLQGWPALPHCWDTGCVQGNYGKLQQVVILELSLFFLSLHKQAAMT